MSVIRHAPFMLFLCNLPISFACLLLVAKATATGAVADGLFYGAVAVLCLANAWMWRHQEVTP